MKKLLITIAVVVLVGCGTQLEPPSISIITAATIKDIEAVKQHLAAGTDVNAKSDEGITVLHEAAWRGSKEIVELLISEGADVNAKDVKGGTPLDLTILYKQAQIAALLRKHGGKTGEELKAEGK